MSMSKELSERDWWVWEANAGEDCMELVHGIDAAEAAENFLERMCDNDWEIFRMASYDGGEPVDVFVRNAKTGSLHRMEVGTDTTPVYRVRDDQLFDNDVHDVPLPPGYMDR